MKVVATIISHLEIRLANILAIWHPSEQQHQLTQLGGDASTYRLEPEQPGWDGNWLNCAGLTLQSTGEL